MAISEEKTVYTCALCNGVFQAAWNDDEANREAKEIWGVDRASESDDFTVVCDSCFQWMAERKPMGPRSVRQ